MEEAVCIIFVAAGAGEVTNLGFAGITQMQEMNSAICSSRANVGESGRLEDTRDRKVYWVTKLKDGNCWMTQNLDLDIPANGLSKDDTDIPVDWNSSSTYKPEATQITTNPDFGTTNNNIKSWDPALGKAATYCNDGTTASKCKTSDNPTTSVNDGHDAQGNYYSWGAVTAGQAASLISSTAGQQSTQSICPKGWQLPENQASTAGTTIVKSYRNLLDSYGWSWNQGSDPSKYSNSLTGTKDGITYNIASSPLYFVYGGRVGDNSLNYAGAESLYWLSTASNDTHAYYFYSRTDVVNPSSNNGNRYHGFSVRCVAR